MKIQSLAVIFIIIVLPISLVLNEYTRSRIKTLSYQSDYDSKLIDSTYDALKAYQINALNSDTSDLTNSKIRDIKASVNVFLNTLSNSLSSKGFTRKSIASFVPALVYTMYDGYYIYTPFKNTWDDNTRKIYTSPAEDIYDSSETAAKANSQNEKFYQTYKDNVSVNGLKPYVYYSCRYKDKNNNYDVVITYSLDNYIQIQGYVDGEYISMYGYVLNNISRNGVEGNYTYTYTYSNGKTITVDNSGEDLKETLWINGESNEKEYPYIKINGTKYYYDGSNVFSLLNGKKVIQTNAASIGGDELQTFARRQKNICAYKYFENAFKLNNFIKSSSLLNLSTADIVDIETGERIDPIKFDNSDISKSTGVSYHDIGKIFEYDDSNNISIEDETSNFNNHRIDVIKNAITKNLAIVINNFNNFSGAKTDFQMPILKEDDWDKIIDNMSIISFLQGINIGGKVYNGYEIVSNTKNEEVVSNDSIYIATGSDNNSRVFHKVTEENLAVDEDTVGIYNINCERRSAQDDKGKERYYYPVYGLFSYDSIVTSNKIVKMNNQSIAKYLASSNNDELTKKYYIALARERQGLYRQQVVVDYNDTKFNQ